MPSCTFFGHRDCPDTIRPALCAAITDLIENHGVNLFYVGNQGHFDAMTRSILRELGRLYPQIGYAVVLAYLPVRHSADDDFSDTMLPEGIETVPKRFAITWRNKWLVDSSDYVVTYLTHTWGGAAKYAELAQKKGKTIISLGHPA